MLVHSCSAEGKETLQELSMLIRYWQTSENHNVTKIIYDIDRIAQDIGGGNDG